MAKNKTIKAEKPETSEEATFKVEVKEIVDCAECGGQGLKDPTQLCGVCAGTGKSN